MMISVSAASATFDVRWRALLPLMILLLTSAAAVEAQTWTRLGLAGQSTWEIDVDPKQPGVIYVSLDAGQGLMKSVDGGATWTAINSGIALGNSPQGTGINIDPANVSRVFAGFSGAGGDPALYQSLDAGATWTAAVTGLPSGAVDTVQFHPTDPDTLYAGSNGFGVAKSINGGDSWQGAASGLEDGFCSVSCVLDLAISPGAPMTLFAAQPVLSAVYRTTNGGDSWQATSLSIMAERVAIDPFDSQAVFANASLGGFSKSSNGGDTWTSLEGPASGLPQGAVFHSIAFDPQQRGLMWTEADFEVYSSTDSGSTWNLTQTGLAGLQIRELAHSGVMVLATTDDGVYGLSTALFYDGFESGNTSAWSSTF